MLVQLPRPRSATSRTRARWARRSRSSGSSRSSASRSPPRSAIQANGIQLNDVVSYYRVLNGFAATVRTSDIGHLNSRGARVRTVRRPIRPAASRSRCPARLTLADARLPGPAADRAARHRRRPEAAQALRGRRLRRRRPRHQPRSRPRPGRHRRVETSGTALGGIVAAAGERMLPIRVASLRATGQSVEAAGTTDKLLAGLERAVDPNGDRDTSDHVAVVLVRRQLAVRGLRELPGGGGRRGRRRARDARRRARRQRGRGQGRRHDRLARRRPRRRRGRRARRAGERRRGSSSRPRPATLEAAVLGGTPPGVGHHGRPGGGDRRGRARQAADRAARQARDRPGRRRTPPRRPPRRPPWAPAPCCSPTRASARCPRWRPAAPPRR